MKKILFLGNSFTYFYDLPRLVELRLGGEYECHSITRGGAYLNAYKSASDELYIKLQELIGANKYDHIVLQEQSFNAIGDFCDYSSSVDAIQEIVGDTPIFIYQTWSYKDGSDMLLGTGLSFDEMTDALEAAANKVALRIGAQIIPVGRVFSDIVKRGDGIELYDPDGLHPSEAGSHVIADVFASHIKTKI